MSCMLSIAPWLAVALIAALFCAAHYLPDFCYSYIAIGVIIIAAVGIYAAYQHGRRDYRRELSAALDAVETTDERRAATD